MEERIREAILASVPSDGRGISNQRLVWQVQEVASGDGKDFDEKTIRSVRDKLVAEGVLVKGRGRGGSVRRTPSQIPSKTGGTAKGSGGTEPRGLSPDVGDGQYGTYQHADLATMRPDVGLQNQFSHRRKPKTYRYDSSIAPEISWDENAERDFAEWLLNLIAEASEKGEVAVFATPRVWQGTGEEFDSLSKCVARLRSLTKPFLDWAGKAERQQIGVPTVPLFVHERHSTRAILEKLKSYKASGQTLELFGDPEADISDKLDAYEHKGPWTNRMILGDSLQVMNSLLEYEGLGGQVQMIYIDPPYGVKFGSNFQPFVRKRDVKHGKDDEMIREPEMVKAYRDTWELGLHSYLSYLRDRLLLARELLTESGSVFVQISDENLHHVREVMDEVFGSDNFVSLITFSKTSGATSELLPSTADYLLWYARTKHLVKYNRVYLPKIWGESGDSAYTRVELPDGVRRSLSRDEKKDIGLLPDGARIYRIDNLTSQRPPGDFPVEFEGKVYRPKRGYWKTGEKGFQSLVNAQRLESTSNSLYYVRYFSDFPVFSLSNRWDDTGVAGFASNKLYVVQTNQKVAERCVLMTTDPGDLILDPTCGSGTTAYVAEQWGRRWITCDTSRIPLALARQRLLTATFKWYDLKNPKRGPAAGFVYKRKQNRKGEDIGGLVSRITLKSIANNEEPETVTLVDRPEETRNVTRVCGPFTVEATIEAAANLEEPTGKVGGDYRTVQEDPRSYLDRMIEVLRRAHTLRLPGNESVALENVRPLGDSEKLHAEARTESNGEEGQRIAVAFGPENGAINSQFVYDAASEAYFLRYDRLYIFGFAIEAKARELVDDRAKLRIPCTYVTVTPDVVMADLLKTSHTDQIFSVTGLPDIELRKVGDRDDGQPLYQTEVLGLDIFRPDNLETKSVEAEDLPCWMLDTDYNGLVFCASQVFFPRTAAWDNLKKSLRADFDDSVWEHLAGTESEPFVLGGHRRVAVKVIDERGNELMAVRSEGKAN